MYIDKSILENLNQEWIIPEINADLCVHSQNIRSDCQLCVDSCPSNAWILDQNSLGMDVNACDGCGLCIPACPSGAIHSEFPWITRQLGARMVALFACEHNSIPKSSDTLACIHSLGIRQILQIYNSGIEHLLLSIGNCQSCPHYHSSDNFFSRLEEVNTLLMERNKNQLKIMQRSAKVWLKLLKTDPVISRGTQLSRRDFFRGGGRQLREQLLILDPLNGSEFRSIPPGQLLPESTRENLHWPWVPRISKQKCNGCDACIRLCPVGALQYSRQQPDPDHLSHEAINPSNDFFSEPHFDKQLNQNTDNGLYVIKPENCTGCGICSSACETAAISIESYAEFNSKENIVLFEKQCTVCGNNFHTPQNNLQADNNLCPVCQAHNHSNNLYQVLD